MQLANCTDIISAGIIKAPMGMMTAPVKPVGRTGGALFLQLLLLAAPTLCIFEIPHNYSMWLAFRFSIVSWVMAAGLVLAPIGVSAWLHLRLHKQLAMALARYGDVVPVARVNGASLWTAGDVRAGCKQLLLIAAC